MYVLRGCHIFGLFNQFCLIPTTSPPCNQVPGCIAIGKVELFKAELFTFFLLKNMFCFQHDKPLLHCWTRIQIHKYSLKLYGSVIVHPFIQTSLHWQILASHQHKAQISNAKLQQLFLSYQNKQFTSWNKIQRSHKSWSCIISKLNLLRMYVHMYIHLLP